MVYTLEESTTESVSPLLDGILKRILDESRSVDSMQKDIFFILIIILMIENGFLPLNEESRIIDPMTSIDMDQLSKWKSTEGIFQAKFIMTGFHNPYLKLLMSPLGSAVLINILINELNIETYTVCLPVSRYVVSPQASTIPMIFRDLKHLSVTFKNKMLVPVKSIILGYHGYPSASFIGLPVEVFFKIIMYLPIIDVVNVSKTCNRLQLLISNNDLWHKLYRRDFNVSSSDFNVTDWKVKYKESYIAQKDEKLRRTRQAAGTMHDFMDYSDYVSYIDNPMWNII